MDRQELASKLAGHDAERVKSYLEILDRMFVNVLVSKLMEKDEVEIVISIWKEYIKSQINYESKERDDFLMGTAAGRLVSYSSDTVKDGESLRLDYLGCMNLADDIAQHNYLLD